MQNSGHQCLSDELVESFISDFYGYGNLDSPHWYIGMEEGGGNSFQEIEQRMKVWRSMGSPVTVNVKSFHKAIGIDKFFTEKPTLQSTWSKLIRVHLALRSENTFTDEIRLYQRDLWGATDGDHCLLELMPLPSPAINKWKYSQFSRIPYLQSKKEFWDYVLPGRIRHLRVLIEKYSPKLVLFYGLSPKYVKAWIEIAGRDMEKTSLNSILMCRSELTIYCVCPHPVAHGLSNERFDSIGRYLRKQLLPLSPCVSRSKG